jgi:hypothetical protein
MAMVHIHETVPAARVHDLVITDAGKEVIVYDKTCHHIHHLNQLAAFTWRNLDGTRTVADLATETGMTAGMVQVALGKLADANLLDGDLPAGVRAAGQTRRSFLRKAAVAGVAIPAVASISAPTAVQATSHCGGFNEPCCGLSCDSAFVCRQGFCVPRCALAGSRCISDSECCSGTCGRNTGMCA